MSDGTGAGASEGPIEGVSDATLPLRERAAAYPDVDPGTSCTQTSFKVRGKAFFYIGEQGGRHKAMFRLKASLPEAEALAAERPEDFQTGMYTTARFSDDDPLPEDLWTRWLDESYAIATGR